MTRVCSKCREPCATYYLVRTRKGIVVECPKCHTPKRGDKKIVKESA